MLDDDEVEAPHAEARRRPGAASSARPAPRSETRPAASTGQSLGQSSGQPAGRTPGGRPEPRRLAGNPIAEARKLAASAASLEELYCSIIERFDGCTLKQGARNTVVFDGQVDALVMIIGEAPGGEEDVASLPFVKPRAGKLPWTSMLATVGLSRTENVYITNCVFWRPPGNRDPSPAEIESARPVLAAPDRAEAASMLLTAWQVRDTEPCCWARRTASLRAARPQAVVQAGPACPRRSPSIPMPRSYLLRRPGVLEEPRVGRTCPAAAALFDELGAKYGPRSLGGALASRCAPTIWPCRGRPAGLPADRDDRGESRRRIAELAEQDFFVPRCQQSPRTE